MQIIKMVRKVPNFSVITKNKMNKYILSEDEVVNFNQDKIKSKSKFADP